MDCYYGGELGRKRKTSFVAPLGLCTCTNRFEPFEVTTLAE